MKPKHRLIIIPVVHTPADMGSLREGTLSNEEYEEAATRFWVKTFQCLRSLPVDFSHLRVYQDGLPDTLPGIVDQIVAETQTANYEILRWFKEQGAFILGTKNLALLLEEYRNLHAIINSRDENAKTTARLEYLKKSAWFLEKRDRYIAQRIKSTLFDGETGILFIGVAHDVGRLLDREMEVIKPEEIRPALLEALRNFFGYGKERR